MTTERNYLWPSLLTTHLNSNPAYSGVFCGLCLVNEQIMRTVWNEELKYVLYVGKKINAETKILNKLGQTQ